jgi:hypothetical protein
VLLLLLTPRMQRLFETAGAATTGPESKVFYSAAAIVEEGIERLLELGLDQDEVEQLRTADLSKKQDLPTSKLNQAALQETATSFSQEAEAAFDELDDQGVSEAFSELVSGCEMKTTGGVGVCELLTEETITGVVGADPSVDGPEPGFAGGVSCRWEGDDGTELAVTVAESSYYDQIAGAYDAGLKEMVSALGDEAFVADGFNYAAGRDISGRSLFIKTGERTVVVAVKARRAAGDPPNDQLVTLAREVLDTLS